VQPDVMSELHPTQTRNMSGSGCNVNVIHLESSGQSGRTCTTTPYDT